MKQLACMLISLVLLSGCATEGPYEREENEINANPAQEIFTVFDSKPDAANYPLTPEAELLKISYALEQSLSPTLSEGTMYLLSALESTTGIDLALHSVDSSEWAAVLNVQANAEDMDDLIWCAPEYMLYTATSGALQPLNDLIAEYAPNYIHAASNCYDGVQALASEQGEIMRLYQFYEAPLLCPSLGVAFRSDWLEALRAAPPETYDDYHDLLMQMKNTYHPKQPFRLLPSGVTGGDNFTAGFGISLGSGTPNGGFFLEDDLVKFGAMEGGFASYVTMMHTWYQEGLISSAYTDEANLYSNSYLIDISTGNCGVFFIPLDSYATLEQMCEFPIQPGMDPVQKHGEKTHLAPNRSTSICAPGFSISANCEQPELAMQVADWFYSEDACFIGNWGENGVSYTLHDGKPIYTDLIQNNDYGLTIKQALLRYTSDWSGIVSMTKQQYFTQEATVIISTWSQQKDSSCMLPAGLQYTDEEWQEFENIMADVSTYLDNATACLISGDMPLAEISSVQHTLKTLKIDRAISLCQTAFNRITP